MPVIAENLTFEKALSGFRSSTIASMEYARICAEMAYKHFRDTGDVCHAQAFIDAIDGTAKNYVRKQAFLAWLAAHSPLAMSNGKLHKDKSDGANEFNNKALEVTFWTFAPEKPLVSFGSDDILKAAAKLVNKFRDEHHAAADENALAMLNRFEAAINGLKQSVKLIAAPPADEQANAA